MRGYLEDEEPDLEKRSRDTEITLGPGAALLVLLGLFALGGLCFWLGYATAHRGAAPAAAASPQPSPQTAAPDQEPLQGSGAIPKPSAEAQAPPPQSPPAIQGIAAPAAEGAANPAAQQSPAAQGQTGSPRSSQPGMPSAAMPAQPQTPSPVRPAFPATSSSPQPAQGGTAPGVRPALPGTAVTYMVQVAAVSREEDAGVLVGALRGRGYTVTARREPADGLIHVRIGPFASHDEAERMCAKLLSDGYNAMIQP